MLSETVTATSGSFDALPVGVVRRPLKTHPDSRGDFTEMFRNEWQGSPLPVQWNLSRNNPNVLRGIQVHARHWDYLCVVAGEMTIGLHDVRPGAPAVPRSAMLQMSSRRLEILVIPPGVAHGFYSPDHSTHLIGVSSYYDPTDHSRCRWDCPELGLEWACDAPELSATDRQLAGYEQLKAGYLASLAAAASGA
ncbi:MAG TPA: dTDP-4-dehydrorhamnose 3,5-epimerase family protein [Dongiaceae bacterium]|jgi:dTDP-4-dehydrorhamnose 3,5-epimerase|nr:dTDP-4-dehydrorhamnose 3,5-epimerase family protein [Dongiaceae bacterium]